MEEQLTKKAFEELLNRHYGVTPYSTGLAPGQATRPLGSYLRSADKEQFDMWYSQYLETGELE